MPLTDAQVIATFGDPRPYYLADGSVSSAWPTLILDYLKLPSPLPLSWEPTKRATVLRVHRRLVEPFRLALEAVHANVAAWGSLGDTGGVYAFRRMSKSKRLSRHSWAIAIDLDVRDNPDGRAGQMHAGVIAAFESAGFEWGGRWWGRERDPMHFEFVDVARLG